MKLKYSFILLLAVIMSSSVLFSSCHDDEEETPLYDDWLGIMTGSFKGNNWEVDDKYKIELSGFSGIPYYKDDIKYMWRFYSYNFPIKINGKKALIGAHILPVVGTWFPQFDNLEDMGRQDMVGVFIFDDKFVHDFEYLPIKPNCIKLTIDEVKKQDLPVLNGTINGVLYNKDDLNDSIILSNVKFKFLNDKYL